MNENLKALIEVAKGVTPSAEHREEQRRSFAFGNAAFENDLITRDMIDQQASKLGLGCPQEPSCFSRRRIRASK